MRCITCCLLPAQQLKALSHHAASHICPLQLAAERLEKMGPMSRDEKIMPCNS